MRRFSIARARALPVPGGALLRRERVRRSALRRRGARRAVGGGRGRDPGAVGAVGGGRLGGAAGVVGGAGGAEAASASLDAAGRAGSAPGRGAVSEKWGVKLVLLFERTLNKTVQGRTEMPWKKQSQFWLLDFILSQTGHNY